MRLILALLLPISLFAEIKVGIVSVLSGDMAELGTNVVKTVKTYEQHNLRHPIKFFYEDAKLSSTDGLKAYQKLINIDQVDFIIGACTSNGTMAAKKLINNSETPTITVVTGGYNIDNAGPYIFRIGNSDILNGYEEAKNFIKNGVKEVALFTEETEYTQDIAKAFRIKFKELGGNIVYDENFLPATTDFRTTISRVKQKKAKGVLMPTQTGTALGLFVKQWYQQGGKKIPIQTTFVAGPNINAHKIAGELINGVGIMNPIYDKSNPKLIDFFVKYKALHNVSPAIPFHSAGTVDSLDHLQNYLDKAEKYEKANFKDYLLTQVKNYKGLMGTYSFDEKGNADLGFQADFISYQK